MARVLRGVFLAGLAITLAAMSVGAAGFGQPPTVSGLSSYVVSPGQVLTVAGNHFSSDLSPGDCGLSGAPTVVFNAIDGSGAHAVKPSSTGAAVCTNTMVKVQVPAFGTGATVYVVDSANQPSNTSSSGFYPQVTVQPSGGVSPTSGPVGTQVTVNGANLKPPTVASTPNFNLTIGGQARAATWGGSISFSPGTTSGDTQVSFAVSGDANNAASPTQAVTVDAGAFTFLSPSLQTSAISGQVVGNRVTLSGANLGSGGTVSFSGGVPGQGVSWSSGAIGVTVPAGAQPGPIAVSVNGFGAVSGPSIALNPLAKAISPGSGSAGQSERVTGYNFGARAGKVSTGGVDQAVTGWSDQAVTFTLGGDADTGSTLLTRADGVAAGAVAFNVVPHLDKVESDRVPKGSQVVVDGNGMGAQAGSVAVGGKPAQTLLWSRDSVLVALPTDLSPGSYPLVLTNAYGGASNALSITIVPGAAPAAPGAAGETIAPSFDNNHNFVKPPKGNSPVQLSLDANPHEASPGSTADLLVTLKLNGKPVNGATVSLSMLSSPAGDYAFTPISGVTDADGVFKARVKISGKPGENIILAQSGVFSDQDHVVGMGSTPAGSVNHGVAVPWLWVGGGALALALVTGGMVLQLRSMRLLAP